MLQESGSSSGEDGYTYSDSGSSVSSGSRSGSSGGGSSNGVSSGGSGGEGDDDTLYLDQQQDMLALSWNYLKHGAAALRPDSSTVKRAFHGVTDMSLQGLGATKHFGQRITQLPSRARRVGFPHEIKPSRPFQKFKSTFDVRQLRMPRRAHASPMMARSSETQAEEEREAEAEAEEYGPPVALYDTTNIADSDLRVLTGPEVDAEGVVKRVLEDHKSIRASLDALTTVAQGIVQQATDIEGLHVNAVIAHDDVLSSVSEYAQGGPLAAIDARGVHIERSVEELRRNLKLLTDTAKDCSRKYGAAEAELAQTEADADKPQPLSREDVVCLAAGLAGVLGVILLVLFLLYRTLLRRA
eukprot:TRINITY_DN2187_c0_g1_i3.p1 TRINITY_DN2187_c0_g1~~TRINITY_DN2187_c0_g1_i3.p1  ORF type:complete len:355 (+),score=102.58 TRINITY_DN2187_c0_g1_i3:417-1481(+)